VLVNHRAITAELLIESNTVVWQPSDQVFLQASSFASCRAHSNPQGGAIGAGTPRTAAHATSCRGSG
jgi:hypothetical protein